MYDINLQNSVIGLLDEPYRLCQNTKTVVLRIELEFHRRPRSSRVPRPVAPIVAWNFPTLVKVSKYGTYLFYFIT